jgi:hypothetical protein
MARPSLMRSANLADYVPTLVAFSTLGALIGFLPAIAKSELTGLSSDIVTTLIGVWCAVIVALFAYAWREETEPRQHFESLRSAESSERTANLLALHTNHCFDIYPDNNLDATPIRLPIYSLSTDALVTLLCSTNLHQGQQGLYQATLQLLREFNTITERSFQMAASYLASGNLGRAFITNMTHLTQEIAMRRTTIQGLLLPGDLPGPVVPTNPADTL